MRPGTGYASLSTIQLCYRSSIIAMAATFTTAAGQVWLGNNGSFQYVASPSGIKSDNFTYTVVDENGNESAVRVTIDVLGVTSPSAQLVAKPPLPTQGIKLSPLWHAQVSPNARFTHTPLSTQMNSCVSVSKPSGRCEWN